MNCFSYVMNYISKYFIIYIQIFRLYYFANSKVL